MRAGASKWPAARLRTASASRPTALARRLAQPWTQGRRAGSAGIAARAVLRRQTPSSLVAPLPTTANAARCPAPSRRARARTRTASIAVPILPAPRRACAYACACACACAAARCSLCRLRPQPRATATPARPARSSAPPSSAASALAASDNFQRAATQTGPALRCATHPSVARDCSLLKLELPSRRARPTRVQRC